MIRRLLSTSRRNDALRWGTLPRLYSLADDEEKRAFLRAYLRTGAGSRSIW